MLDTLVGERKLDGVQAPSWTSVELPAVQNDQLAAEESDRASSVAVPPATAALWAVLATVVMLFAGFTSAYLVRRASPDWLPIYAPPILWINTALLLLSSLALEIAKTSRKFGRQTGFRGWFLAGLGLGAAFLAGQWAAWRELATIGIFLPTSPHGAFFYMLSGVHAVHVIGGILALAFVLLRRWNSASKLNAAADPVNLCAIYWHFVTGIWVYLYWLLFVWR